MKATPNDTTLITRQFLVRCVRSFLAGKETPPLSPLPEEQVDWDSLVPLAVFHRVAPLLDRAWRDGCPQTMPTSVRADLAAYVRSTASRSLLLTGELARLLRQLETQGIEALPYKGPVLSVMLYDDLALRDYKDLDLLVRRQDFAAARNLILSLGYQPKAQQHKFHEAFTLTRGDSEIEVELHWNIVAEDFPLHLDIEGIWERCAAFSLGGAPTATLSPEDLLLFLCVHGAWHWWLRLQWLCDVAQLVRRSASMDWEGVVEQAKLAGGKRALFLGLFLANDILGAPLPHEVEQEVRSDPLTAKLAGQVRWRLFEGPLQLFKPWKKEHFFLQLIDRAWVRLTYSPRHWFQVLTTPTYEDRDTLRLPAALSPLYPVLRPVRLVYKHSSRAVRQFFNRHKGT